MKVQQTSEFKRILNADTQNIRITNADGQIVVAPGYAWSNYYVYIIKFIAVR